MVRIESALVGVDLSPISDKLVGWLPVMRRIGLTRIVLSYVVPSSVIEHVAGGILVDKIIEEHTEEARRIISRYSSFLEKRGFKVEEAEIEVGEPAPILSAQAERYDTDIVVVGSRGRGWLRELLLGSTAEELVRISGKPVLVVKGFIKKSGAAGKEVGEPIDPFEGPLLLPIDFHEATDKVIDYAVYIASKSKQKLVILHVVEMNEDISEINAFMDRLRENLKAQGLEASTVLIDKPGPPAKIILEEAKKHRATLIVMGPHGRGRGLLRGLLLGTTTDTVLRYSNIPILVVRSEESKQKL